MQSLKDSGIPFISVFGVISMALIFIGVLLTVIVSFLIKFTIPTLIVISCICLFFLVSWQISRIIWKHNKKV